MFQVLRTNCIPDAEFKYFPFVIPVHLTFVFTILKNCSTGVRIGEYGGRKLIFNSSFCIISFVLLDQWYGTLSSIIIDLFITSIFLNSRKYFIIQRKAWNQSEFTVEFSTAQINSPSDQNAVIKLLLPEWFDLQLRMWLPLVASYSLFSNLC